MKTLVHLAFYKVQLWSTLASVSGETSSSGTQSLVVFLPGIFETEMGGGKPHSDNHLALKGRVCVPARS